MFGRVRRFLGLSQLDVAVATGIPVGRLSRAERGNGKLTVTEQRILNTFLKARVQILLEAEGNVIFDDRVEAIPSESGPQFR